MSTDKFNITRYIYSLDSNDQRGIAWTKYVLNYIVNGEGVDTEGNSEAVVERKNKVFNRQIADKGNRKVAELFGLPFNNDAKKPIHHFIRKWLAYLSLISKTNINENRYANKLYRDVLGNNFNALGEDIKKIFSAIFYIGSDLTSTPFVNGNDVNALRSATTLGKPILAPNDQIYINYDLLFDNMEDFLEQEELIRLINQMNELNLEGITTVYENYLKPQQIGQNVWPQLTPEKYFSKIFNNLSDLKYANSKFEKYEDNGHDLQFDKTIVMNAWEKGVNKEGKKIYLKTVRGKQIEVDIDEEFRTSGDNCHNLNISNSACKPFINAILLSSPEDSASALAEFIKSSNPNVFGDLKHTINDVHPGLALIILKRFGFKKNKKNEIISVGDWLENYMTKYFNNKEITSIIKKNYRLLDFLDYLVRFINYNPMILDPNIQVISKPDEMKNYYFIQTDRRTLEEDLKYHQLSRKNFRPLKANTLDPLSAPFASTFNAMYGGADDSDSETNSVSTTEELFTGYTHGHKLMTSYFNNVKAELQKYGKKLDERDSKFIQKQINNLKYYEEDIFKKLQAINNILEKKNDDERLILTEDKLSNITKLNKFNRVKTDYNLQEDQIINALLNALDKIKDSKFNEAPIPLN